jgi:inosine-uridine nucleoside N-ribohydrolase
MTKLIIDCDPGHDDAIAILLAARHLELLGITTTFGNARVAQTTENALRLLALAGLDIPVARGCDEALVEPPLDGGALHGATGMDGADLPPAVAEPLPVHAVEFLIEQARAHAGELVVALTGTQTNLALALRLEPRLCRWLRAITLMGGSAGVGNVRAMACINVVADPEAAQIVFASGVPIHWAGYELTRTVLLQDEDIARLRASGRKVAGVVADLCAFYRERQRAVLGLDGAPIHDCCAIVPYVRPELITYEEVAVEVALAPGPTRGMTIVDRRDLVPGADLGRIEPKRPANARLAVDADRRAIVDLVLDTVLTYA